MVKRCRFVTAGLYSDKDEFDRFHKVEIVKWEILTVGCWGDVLRASTRAQTWSDVSQRPQLQWNHLEVIESPSLHNLPRYKQGKAKLWSLRRVRNNSEIRSITRAGCRAKLLAEAKIKWWSQVNTLESRGRKGALFRKGMRIKAP